MSKKKKHTSYWNNGQKSDEGTYKDGKPNGEWVSYKEDGFIDKVENY